MTPSDFYKWDREETLKELNRRYNVYESVEMLKGFHLVGAQISKPGVYRVQLSSAYKNGWQFVHGFASQQIVTTAIELGYLSKPNGYTLP